MPNITTLRELDIHPELLKGVSTGRPALDQYWSTKGGVRRGTITMTYAEPGAGKTITMCDLLCGAQSKGANVLYISSEMDHTDMAEYSDTFIEFLGLPTWFIDFDQDGDIVADIRQVLSEGAYDIILIDSWEDVKNKVKAQRGCSGTSAEHMMLDVVKKAKKGDLVPETFTSFLLIQQVTKGGDYAGSKSLEHLITASLKLEVDGSERHMLFEKNRRGNAKKKLYYNITDDGLSYDRHRLDLEDEAHEAAQEADQRSKERRRGQDNIESLFRDSASDSEGETDSSEELDKAFETLLNEDREDLELPGELTVELVNEYAEANNGVVTRTHRELVKDGVLSGSVNDSGQVSGCNVSYHDFKDIMDELGLR